MFKKNKRFSSKTIWYADNYNNIWQVIVWSSKRSWFSKILILILCVVWVIFVSKYVIDTVQATIWYVGKTTVKTVSKSIWQEMIKDDFWNVNIMLIWYGGADHAGWYLADTIIVASRNPNTNIVTMVSVPRDLYIYNKQEWVIWRINQVFSHWMGYKKNFQSWVNYMQTMLEDITWLKIKYYALVDFGGFKDVVDTIWWITIDVPQTIHDVTYPGPNNTYTTFHINSWVQNLDGETALKYARSRHSTSDFSRSLRQQQIIKAIIEKMLSSGTLHSISKIKNLYTEYTKMVKTNIQLKEMIWAFKYINDLKDNIFSFWLTTECSNNVLRFSHPGCFLYTPDRSFFGWASVIIPDWATVSNVAFYDHIRNFVFFVAHKQEYLKEKTKIWVFNGIDKEYSKQVLKKSDWFALKTAVKLRKYAFDITEVENFVNPIPETSVYILWTWNYDETIDTLKYFLNVKNIFHDTGFQYQYTGIDMMLVLGNDYIDQLAQKPFSYYK